jgi:hypothetical protein
VNNQPSWCLKNLWRAEIVMRFGSKLGTNTDSDSALDIRTGWIVANGGCMLSTVVTLGFSEELFENGVLGQLLLCQVWNIMWVVGALLRPNRAKVHGVGIGIDVQREKLLWINSVSG